MSGAHKHCKLFFKNKEKASATPTFETIATAQRQKVTLHKFLNQMKQDTFLSPIQQ